MLRLDSAINPLLAMDNLLGTPKRLALLEHLVGPDLHLRERHLGGHVRKLAEVDLALAALLVLDHLQQQLHLVHVVHKVAVERLRVLVLLPDGPHGRAGRAARDVAQEVRGQKVHRLGLAAALFRLGDAVDGRDIADEELGHVVDQAHLHAFGEVEAGGERGGCEH